MKQVINNTLIIVLVAGLLNACSALKSVLPEAKKNSVKTIHLITSSDVNQSTAVAVDIVFVFEQTLAAQLTQYTARKWFNEKSQFGHQYAGRFTVFDYEMVPLSQEKLVLSNEKKHFTESHNKAVKVIVFANYLKDSAYYTIDITSYQRPVLTLDQTELTLAEGNQS